MNLIKQIENDIKNNTYSPVYLFMGEEEYYIDYLTKLIINNSLQDHEKDFNLNILYGKDTLISDIISISKQYPVMSERKLVVVKEAQDLSKKDAEGNSLDDLLNYVNNPLNSTILVLNFGVASSPAAILLASESGSNWITSSIGQPFGKAI